MAKQSAYLADPNRLADVIAAIQVLGTHKYYKQSFAQWSTMIEGDDAQAAHWERLFRDHAEFFRVDKSGQRASLVWRRSYPKTYDVDRQIRLTPDELKASPDGTRLSRPPLGGNEITSLIKSAIDMHSRALEHEKDRRWWFPIVSAGLAAAMGFGGAVLGAFIRGSN
jgi:hypothetical protein